MENKLNVILSTLGLGFLLGAIGCSISTLNLIQATWELAANAGVSQALGYLIATGIATFLSTLAVPLFVVFGTALMVGPWSEARPS